MKIKKRAAAFAAAMIIIICLCISAGASSWWKGDVLTSNYCGRKQIALTFDDGPHPTQTDKILDILKKYEVKATFFVVGENAALYPEQIKREIAEGHEIGNHTYSHTTLKNKPDAVITQEVLSVEDTLFEICEYRTKLLRPPGGLYRESLCKYASENDYTVVLWSVDTRDWAHRRAKAIRDDVLDKILGGDIILCHDYIGGKSPTAEALEMLIPALKQKGFEFVTVSTLNRSE